VVGSLRLLRGQAPGRDGEELVHQIGSVQRTLEKEARGELVLLDVQLGRVLLELEADE
jgi:hypothetical protein